MRLKLYLPVDSIQIFLQSFSQVLIVLVMIITLEAKRLNSHKRRINTVVRTVFILRLFYVLYPYIYIPR